MKQGWIRESIHAFHKEAKACMTLEVIYGLPSKRFEEIGRLPSICAVYFAIAASSEVLYIGSALDLLRRWYRHHRLLQLHELQCTSIAWEECLSKDVNTREHQWIEKIRPRLNKTRMPAWTSEADRLNFDVYTNTKQTNIVECSCGSCRRFSAQQDGHSVSIPPA
jgi:predicted GIY-YIG superfamily endonuclease